MRAGVAFHRSFNELADEILNDPNQEKLVDLKSKISNCADRIQALRLEVMLANEIIKKSEKSLNKEDFENQQYPEPNNNDLSFDYTNLENSQFLDYLKGLIAEKDRLECKIKELLEDNSHLKKTLMESQMELEKADQLEKDKLKLKNSVDGLLKTLVERFGLLDLSNESKDSDFTVKALEKFTSDLQSSQIVMKREDSQAIQNLVTFFADWNSQMIEKMELLSFEVSVKSELKTRNLKSMPSKFQSAKSTFRESQQSILKLENEKEELLRKLDNFEKDSLFWKSKTKETAEKLKHQNLETLEARQRYLDQTKEGQVWMKDVMELKKKNKDLEEELALLKIKLNAVESNDSQSKLMARIVELENSNAQYKQGWQLAHEYGKQLKDYNDIIHQKLANAKKALQEASDEWKLEKESLMKHLENYKAICNESMATKAEQMSDIHERAIEDMVSVSRTVKIQI